MIQHTHTYISDAANPLTSVTSRLDRFYISHCEADWATVKPYAYIPTIPHTLLRATPSTNNATTDTTPKKPVAHSDHLPVAIGFRVASDDDETKSDPRIPLWITQDPQYPLFFAQLWRDVAHKLNSHDSFARLACFKACMYDAAT